MKKARAMRGPLISCDSLRRSGARGGGVLMPGVFVGAFLLAARTLACRSLLLEAGKLDYRKLGSIATAEAILYHASVATRAILVARRDLIEELLHRLMRLKVRERA